MKRVFFLTMQIVLITTVASGYLWMLDFLYAHITNNTVPILIGAVVIACTASFADYAYFPSPKKPY